MASSGSHLPSFFVQAVGCSFPFCWLSWRVVVSCHIAGQPMTVPKGSICLAQCLRSSVLSHIERGPKSSAHCSWSQFAPRSNWWLPQSCGGLVRFLVRCFPRVTSTCRLVNGVFNHGERCRHSATLTRTKAPRPQDRVPGILLATSNSCCTTSSPCPFMEHGMTLAVAGQCHTHPSNRQYAWSFRGPRPGLFSAA